MEKKFYRAVIEVEAHTLAGAWSAVAESIPRDFSPGEARKAVAQGVVGFELVEQGGDKLIALHTGAE